jgi:NAD(P)-dependent dehydrogenase (short-subunit alcohol dehydrogenase family)
VTVVVTGSASGIGAATAARLARDGHRVIGVDVHDADVVADLSTPDGRSAVLAAITEPLDGVVTCAGLGPLPARAGSAIVAVNYFGTVALLDGLRPQFRSGGAAVAISSNSTTCSPGVPEDLADLCLAGDEPAALARADEVGGMGGSYPASKLAVARWVRARAVSADWIGGGIRLNAVAPGLIETALIAEGRADATVGPLLDLFPIPAGRSGQPDEVAALIAFLLGPESSLLCGSIVFADGGTDALLRANDWPAPWEPDPSTLGALFNSPR